MIWLEEINPKNWRMELNVAEEQKDYVSDSMKLLARAYAYRNCRSEAFVIYEDKCPIGMALYYDWEVMQAYDFSQFFIDEKYQGNGYGFEAVKQIIEKMKMDGKYQKVILCYIEGNEAAKKLYEKVGFRCTGEQDGNEIIMKLDL